MGIRPLGAAGRDLILDGKRWVLRGVCGDESPAAESESPGAKPSTSLMVDSPK